MGQSESHNAIAFFNNPQLFGNIKGGVMFFGKPEGHTEVKIRLSGFQPHSIHAIHIHEYGDISKGCKSTGAHFNPFGLTHGSRKYPQKPRHAGDLINNITANENGQVSVDFEDHLFEVKDILGRAVVIHDLTDDLGLQGRKFNKQLILYENMPTETLYNMCKERNYFSHATPRDLLIKKLNEESLKTGNAGGRMACSVIGLMKSS